MPADNAKAILDHLGLYGITTVDLLHRQVFPNASREAARKAASRLRDSGDLASFKIHNRAFYHLASVKAPNENELWKKYGTAAFCIDGNRPRRRITAEAFQMYLPAIAEAKGVSPDRQDYFIEERDDAIKIGRIYSVRHPHRDSTPKRCRTILGNARTVPGFRELMACGLYELAVLTHSEETARLLRKYLGAVRLRPNPVVYHVDALGHLL